MQIETANLLLQKAFEKNYLESQWADLGCGSGFFTRALAQQLAQGSTIYAVDKSDTFQRASDQNKKIVINFHEMNFEKEQLPFHSLDGILMANSLHFVKDKKTLL